MPGSGLRTSQPTPWTLAPLSAPPQLRAGSVSSLFPFIRPLPLPGAGGPAGQLFPTIHPSPSPAPGSGGPQSGLSSGTRPPPGTTAAGRTAPGTSGAHDSMLTVLPPGGGQVAGLCFLALAAALTAGAARSRMRRRG